jgi:hypothetical protein
MTPARKGRGPCIGGTDADDELSPADEFAEEEICKLIDRMSERFTIDQEESANGLMIALLSCGKELSEQEPLTLEPLKLMVETMFADDGPLSAGESSDVKNPVAAEPRLYHYTDRLTGADILKDGRIRTRKQTLYKDMHGAHSGRAGFETPPLLWLTTDPVMEMTVYWKMIGAKWPEGLVNDLWRFVLPPDYSPLGLAEYAKAKKIDLDWWKCVVASGHVGGSDYTTWRLHSRPIPKSDWTRVEILSGYDDQGNPIWTPLSER